MKLSGPTKTARQATIRDRIGIKVLLFSIILSLGKIGIVPIYLPLGSLSHSNTSNFRPNSPSILCINSSPPQRHPVIDHVVQI